MGKYFGTDGIRDKAEKFSLEFLEHVASGLIKYAKTKGKEKFRVFIGGDTRESTEKILENFEKIFSKAGVECFNVGVLSTPAINYSFFEMGFDFAIDVTASHNPYQDNGIKIFERGEKSGVKLSSEGREIIEAAIFNQEKLEEFSNSVYREHVEKYLGDCSFSGMKIGLDFANGATSIFGGEFFEKFGAEVFEINRDKNFGKKINFEAGSTHIEHLQKLVLENHLDFGAAFDGDGDRCLMVDENGEVVDGDQILAIIVENFNLDSFVTTLMANQGLINWAKEKNKKFILSDVGDQYVLAKMIEENIPIGGEQSGHVILPGEATGDGMLTALVVAKILSETKIRLSELAKTIKKCPQILVNFSANEMMKNQFKESQEIQEILKKEGEEFEAKGGRILVRASGTEELIRVTVWGNSEEEIKVEAEKIVEILKRNLEKE